MVAAGYAEIAICGGTEAPLFRCPLVELRATGLTPGTDENARRVDRPFDLWRTTGVVSEGACMIVIEPENSPRRGYCRIGGYAFANDLAEDVCGGLRSAITHAIADAGIRSDSIDAINAWGPGHSRIDAAEASVLRDVFGSRLGSIPAVSIKGAVGNPLGAAPAMQVAVAALAMREGILPPTVNWEYPDPACDLNLSSRSRFLAHDSVLVNAHGLSGVNASIVMLKS
jgi:3-oxoacyl-(acyl-carrier-protein) synthase